MKWRGKRDAVLRAVATEMLLADKPVLVVCRNEKDAAAFLAEFLTRCPYMEWGRLELALPERPRRPWWWLK